MSPQDLFSTLLKLRVVGRRRKKIAYETERKNKMIRNLLSQGLCATPLSDTSSNFADKVGTVSIPPIHTMNAPSYASKGSQWPRIINQVVSTKSSLQTDQDIDVDATKPSEKNKTEASMVDKQALNEQRKTATKV